MVVPYLDRATPFSSESVCSPILRLVFGERKLTAETARAELTAAQVEVMTHLYNNLSLWATNHWQSAFHALGLSERKDWARVLAIVERPLSDSEIVAVLEQIIPGQQLGRPATVRSISLRQIGTAAFLPHLRQYADLEELVLSDVELHDQDMVHLSCFPKLRVLHLNGVPITDAGVRELAKLPGLTDLYLAGTGITDAGLAALGDLPRMKYVYLGRTAVSDEAVRRFQAAHPEWRVYR